MLQAIIFDFDGVICDTEPLHYRAYARALADQSIAITEDEYFTTYAGMNDQAVLRAVCLNTGNKPTDQTLEELRHSKDEVYLAMIAKGVERLPGVDRLVPRLARQWPLAICSGARRIEIETILKHAGLQEYFRIVITADEVQASKPDPAGFMVSLKRLRHVVPDLTAQQCLVIEDSPYGIAAARAAGMKVLGVQNRLAARQLRPADATVPTLRCISAESLAAMFDDRDAPGRFSSASAQQSESDTLRFISPEE